MRMQRRAKAPIVSGVLHFSQPHEDCIPLLRTSYRDKRVRRSIQTALGWNECLVRTWPGDTPESSDPAEHALEVCHHCIQAMAQLNCVFPNTSWVDCK